mmetsp:Transcript_5571/g.8485  ORF Transcript_5571/g.8485 Transcript_5571/m.8485 type:complete len:913 (-) Transcript_5571:190-2928(-)
MNEAMVPDVLTHRRERAWNSQVTEPGPPPLRWRRAESPDNNLKNLVIKGKLPAVSAPKTLPTRTSIDATSATPSAFNSIAATFGFQHHHGTDRNVELKVLKLILKRENMLSVLSEICFPKHTNQVELQNKKGTGVLDMMTEIRKVTVDLVEMVCYWRTTMVGQDPEVPRPFIYEDRNYLLKVITDLDFLGDVSSLIDGLGISQDKMLKNPLMLPETLDVEKLSSMPEEWAEKDANGDTESELYQERLRLRKVEHILLQEMEFNKRGSPSIAWNESSILTSVSTDGGYSEGRHVVERAMSAQRKMDMLDWYNQARAQMLKLELAQSEKLNADIVSTHRLEIPDLSKEPPRAKYSYSPPRMVEPITLYELASTNVDEPLGYSRSRSPTSPPQTSKVRRVKGLPEPQTDSRTETMVSLFPELEITSTDLHTVSSLSTAPRSLTLAGAAILIVLADGTEVPDDITWEAFRGAAIRTVMAEEMNAVMPYTIPNYKVRAMTPFLTGLREVHEEDIKSDASFSDQSSSKNPGTKIINWVIEVMTAATNPPTNLNQSTSQSSFRSVMSRRSAATAARKKRAAQEKNAIPSDLKVIYSTESTELLPETTLKIYLLLPRKKPPTTQLKRYIVKVVNEENFQTAEAPINAREMESYKYDLRESFPNVDINEIFKPASSNWWKTYLTSIVTVKQVNPNEISLRVSKRLIKNVVGGLAAERKQYSECDSVSEVSLKDLVDLPPQNGGWDFHTQSEEEKSGKGSAADSVKKTVDQPETHMSPPEGVARNGDKSEENDVTPQSVTDANPTDKSTSDENEEKRDGVSNNNDDNKVESNKSGDYDTDNYNTDYGESEFENESVSSPQKGKTVDLSATQGSIAYGDDEFDNEEPPPQPEVAKPSAKVESEEDYADDGYEDDAYADDFADE